MRVRARRRALGLLVFMHSRSDHALGASLFDGGTVSAGKTLTADLDRFGIAVAKSSSWRDTSTHTL
ncbi:hypothetical protein EKPJFOCH_3658 [Methylobacterium thuringiense]|uniref:Uncharacterized protein n=2 Tax=Methylobacterium thuringiense TaxID=1003091 RepID=A0ABQ4TQ77_9HYPH|nr:hypothetical protein EKPJFOCH_3658 [Methylobacterium thuringiense]